jgi:hypothetical protein
MSEQEQVERLREKRYILPKEHADAFVRDVAVYVAKTHDKEIGSMLENSLKDYDGPDIHKKAAAIKRMNGFKPMLHSWGFNWDALEKEGAEEGFGRDLFTKHAGQVDIGYIGSWRTAYVSQAKEKEVHDYIDDISKEKDLKGFEVDIAKSKKYEEKLNIVSAYYQSKKLKDLAGFKDKHQYLFK